MSEAEKKDKGGSAAVDGPKSGPDRPALAPEARPSPVEAQPASAQAATDDGPDKPDDKPSPAETEANVSPKLGDGIPTVEKTIRKPAPAKLQARSPTKARARTPDDDAIALVGKARRAKAKSPKARSPSKRSNVQSKTRTRFTKEEKKKIAELRARKAEAKRAGNPAKKEIQVPEDVVESVLSGGLMKRTCITALIGGEINSYVDLFYLTHRGGGEDDDDNPARQVDPEQLPYIAENLRCAEQWKRQDKIEKVYGCYVRLATYFQEVDDVKTGVYFLEKAMDTATRFPENNYVGSCRRNDVAAALAAAHTKLKSYARAVSFSENAFVFAQESKDAKRIAKAQSDLFEAYVRESERREEDGDLGGAKELWIRSLALAQQSGSDASEVRAYVALGRLAMSEAQRSSRDAEAREANLTNAIGYGEKALEKARATGDVKSEGKAYALQARARLERGEKKDAMASLEAYLKVSTKSGDTAALQNAYWTIGSVMADNKMYAKAVPYFEQAAKFATEMGSVGLADEARVALGTARGNSMLGAYMNLVQDNGALDQIMAWKLQRTAFDGKA